MALFKPGASGNPAGRHMGARSKLTEAVFKVLAEDFEEHGKQAIAECRDKSPSEYLRIRASLIPKSLIGEGIPSTWATRGHGGVARRCNE
jgi:hypothetical protein